MSRTQPEARIVAAILRRLNAAPDTYARKTHGNAYSVGWPDIVGCSAGRMLAIEVKQPGKKATPRQAHELAKWAAAGALVGVATSVEEAVAIAWRLNNEDVTDEVAALTAELEQARAELAERDRELAEYRPVVEAAVEVVEHDPIYSARWYQEDDGPHARMKKAVDALRASQARAETKGQGHAEPYRCPVCGTDDPMEHDGSKHG